MLGLFSSFFNSEQFTDVIITAEGKAIRAHKVRDGTGEPLLARIWQVAVVDIKTVRSTSFPVPPRASERAGQKDQMSPMNN